MVVGPSHPGAAGAFQLWPPRFSWTAAASWAGTACRAHGHACWGVWVCAEHTGTRAGDVCMGAGRGRARGRGPRAAGSSSSGQHRMRWQSSPHEPQNGRTLGKGGGGLLGAPSGVPSGVPSAIHPLALQSAGRRFPPRPRWRTPWAMRSGFEVSSTIPTSGQAHAVQSQFVRPQSATQPRPAPNVALRPPHRRGHRMFREPSGSALPPPGRAPGGGGGVGARADPNRPTHSRQENAPQERNEIY